VTPISEGPTISCTTCGGTLAPLRESLCGEGPGEVDARALSETRRRLRPAGAPDLPPATTLGHGALEPLDDPSLN
jgi:hypothetical protein